MRQIQLNVMCGLNLAYERNTDILYSSQKLAVVSCSIIPYTNMEVYYSIGLMVIKDTCHEYFRRRSVFWPALFVFDRWIKV